MNETLNPHSTLHLPEEYADIETEPQHNCAVAGLYYFGKEGGPFTAISHPMTLIQSRGQEGFGMTGKRLDRSIVDLRNIGLIRDRANELQVLTRQYELVRFVIGQCKYSTSGGLDIYQPILSPDLITAHNGTISNPLSFLQDIPQDQHEHLYSDSHMLHEFIRSRPGRLDDKLKAALPYVEGAFSLVLADIENESMYAVRDPWGFRPLHYAFLPDNAGVIVASETIALLPYVKADQIFEVDPGECIKIIKTGLERIQIDYPEVDRAHCIFEPIYFGHPGSEIYGIPVGKYRRKCGRTLAERDIESGFIPDIIVPILHSGSLATEGYSQRLVEYLSQQGYTPEEVAQRVLTEGIYASQYASNRTFILPTAQDREKAIAIKFAIDEDRVRGKSIVIVDDSIVRGATMKKLIKRLKEAGAKAVHVRIASAPIRYGCYYGIDFTNERQELIATGRTIEEIRTYIEADSLRYLYVEDQLAIAHELQNPERCFCQACFDGTYPTKIDQNLLFRKPTS